MDLCSQMAAATRLSDGARGADAALSAASARPEGAYNRRGGTLYLFASGLAQASALLRYVVLARLLGPEQLGLAATLVITASFFDLISDTGSDRFLVQDRDGDTVEVQNLVQLLYVTRALLIAAALVVFSIPIAHLYRTPRLAVGLAFLALSPLILGFVHLDVRRAQRRHDFRPDATCMIAAEIASLVTVIAAAWLTRNFTAILYGLIVRALVMVAVSHLTARRPYGLKWSREHAARLTRFSGPLVLNGLMLFIGLTGDRVLVANQLSVKALGYYSAVLMLIFYPSGMLVRYIHAVYMPMVAAARDDPAERARVADILGGQTQLLALAMAAGFAVVAPPMVGILYGARFTEPALLVGMIGILQTTRFQINWPSTVALGMGRTGAVLISNLARLATFPTAVAGLWLIGGLLGIVVGFTAGEFLSLAVSLALLNRDASHPPLWSFDRLATFALAAAIILAWNFAIAARSVIGESGLWVATVGLALWVSRREAGALAELLALPRRLAAPLFLRARAP